MADFFQNGLITTLQMVGDRKLEDMENELREFTRRRKVALLLPALYSEFERPAMHRILEELKGADYLDRIVLSLDQANRKQFDHVRKLMSDLPQEVRIIWNHGERVSALYDELLKENFPVNIAGKGRVVWMAIGYILSDTRTHTIALHDCDIVNYSRGLVARLIYPLVHPGLSFEYSKGYYARVTDRLYGRVTRLFYTPLVRALRQMTDHRIDFLDYLDSFRYALSGEFAIVRDVAQGLRVSPTWGLEVSLLSEIWQNAHVNRICQVEVLETYEHKHSELAKDKPNEGLLRMATDIAKTLFRILSQDGTIMSPSFFRTLLTTYIQHARRAIEQYDALAAQNGLNFDRHQEIRSVEAFCTAIDNAKREYIRNPIGIRNISAWVRVNSALPEFRDKLRQAVDVDNLE